MVFFENFKFSKLHEDRFLSSSVSPHFSLPLASCPPRKIPASFRLPRSHTSSSTQAPPSQASSAHDHPPWSPDPFLPSIIQVPVFPIPTQAPFIPSPSYHSYPTLAMSEQNAQRGQLFFWAESSPASQSSTQAGSTLQVGFTPQVGATLFRNQANRCSQ